jgi:hypothetical protein
MYNSTSKGYICGPAGNGVGGSFGATFGTAGLTSCNPDYNIAQIGTQTQWTPVKNLTFSADLLYTHLDQKYAHDHVSGQRRYRQAGRRVRAEGPEHSAPHAPRSAQLVIPVDLTVI